MKRYVGFVVFMALGMMACLMAQADAPEVASGKAITVMDAAGLPDGMLDRISAFARKQLRVPVRARTVKPMKKQELRKSAEQLQKKRKQGDVCLIVLVRGDGSAKLHATIERDLETATVNVAQLFAKDRTVFMKRLQRQVMRGAGFLFGLKPAPDPFCVTRHYHTLDELDKMGMNFCPPWQGRFKKAAQEKGLADLTPRPPIAK